jgi:hypothetical protein
MSELICLFCQQELHDDHDGYYSCYTDNCSGGANLSGTKELWQALDRTKKQLEIAVDALDTVRQWKRKTALIYPKDIAVYCDKKIEYIKALEQKEE